MRTVTGADAHTTVIVPPDRLYVISLPWRSSRAGGRMILPEQDLQNRLAPSSFRYVGTSRLPVRRSVQALRTTRRVGGLRMDNRRSRLSPSIRLILHAAVVACFLTNTAISAFAETGAIMIAIEKLKVGSPPAEFSFALHGTRHGGRLERDRRSDGISGARHRANQHRSHRLPLSARDPREYFRRQV